MLRFMSQKPAVPILVMSLAGFLLGYATHRKAPDEAQTSREAAEATPRSRRSHEIPAEAKVTAIHLPHIRSEESLETLIAKGAHVTYGELALWLVDASALEIAEYWKAHLHDDATGDPNGDLRRLIFYNWTRLDPHAAIAAVAGTNRAMAAWSAWGTNDPQAALTAAAAAGGEPMKSVANGIGQMQPAWLRKHFDQIPEEAQKAALDGLMTWKEDSDSAARLDFLRAHGVAFHQSSFRTLAQKDPWAAYEWMQKNQDVGNRYYDPLGILLETMKESHPDDLERMAAMTPSGAMKRKIEDAIFANLLATDPEAAMAKAKATDAPMIAADRLGKIGALFFATDPEKAFQIAADMLAASPQRLTPEMMIKTEYGSSNWHEPPGAADNFLESLLIKDPARTMDMAITGGENVSKTFEILANKWAERDLSGYAEWVNQQPDSPTRTAAARQVVSRLSRQGHFQEAADWAISGAKPDEGALMGLVLYDWLRSNKDEAAAWVEANDLPENVRHQFKMNLLHHSE